MDPEIADKEFILPVGPSGCGKSTRRPMLIQLFDAATGINLIWFDATSFMANAKMCKEYSL